MTGRHPSLFLAVIAAAVLAGILFGPGPAFVAALGTACALAAVESVLDGRRRRR